MNIPFRNEAKNLEALLTSVLSLRYDKEKYEVILIDDKSEDDVLTNKRVVCRIKTNSWIKRNRFIATLQLLT